MGTEASQDATEAPSRPKQAIVKPCVRIDTTSNEYHPGSQREDTETEVEHAAVVKPCLHFSENSSSEDSDYVPAQIVQK